MCINNNSVINNNFWQTPRPYFLSKIRMGTQKDFFEIYRQFEYAPTKRLANPRLNRELFVCLNIIRSPEGAILQRRPVFLGTWCFTEM